MGVAEAVGVPVGVLEVPGSSVGSVSWDGVVASAARLVTPTTGVGVFDGVDTNATEAAVCHSRNAYHSPDSRGNGTVYGSAIDRRDSGSSVPWNTCACNGLTALRRNASPLSRSRAPGTMDVYV